MIKVQKSTLVIVYDKEEILLGMKKKGFGVGKWNGFGGKVEKEEGIFNVAEREFFEESGLKIKQKNSLIKRGRINFCFDNNLEEILEVNIFSIFSNKIIGKAKETEEMMPNWFKRSDIPFENMWVDDIYWLPLLLAGKNFTGNFLFTKNGNKILKKELNVDK